MPDWHIGPAVSTRIRAELGWAPTRSDLRSIVTDAWEAVGGC
jgi:UDP-glucose 4-epimerase